MATGDKTIETRNRMTKVRGEVAICAAKKQFDTLGKEVQLLAIDRFGRDWRRTMPSAAVVAVVELYDCVCIDYCWIVEATEGQGDQIGTAQTAGYLIGAFEPGTAEPLGESKIINPTEYLLGDYTPHIGRHGWLTRNRRKLAIPVPVTGHQGFFNLPPHIEAHVRSDLQLMPENLLRK